MKYCFYNLNPDQFEDLIVRICRKLFGAGFLGFSSGKDGGRDGYFCGVAEEYPSRNSPWSGTTIIQVKHSSRYKASYSDKDFFEPKEKSKKTLNREIPKIQKLKKKGQIDNYLLFSNRSLTGGKFQEIKSFLSKQCDIPERNISICGEEQIQAYLEDYPEIYNCYIKELDPVDFAPNINFETLAEIIENIAEILKTDINEDNYSGDALERISFKEKNQKNRLGEDYASFMKEKFIVYSSEITSFLKLPENKPVFELYKDAAIDLNCKILTYQKEHELNEVFETLIFQKCFNDSQILNNHKQETRALIYHMYWACDIGTRK